MESVLLDQEKGIVEGEKIGWRACACKKQGWNKGLIFLKRDFSVRKSAEIIERIENYPKTQHSFA